LAIPALIVSNFDASNLALAEKLTDLAIQQKGGRGTKTTSFAIHVKGDGRDMRLLSTSERIEVEHLQFLEAQSSGFRGHLHLGPLFGNDINVDAIEYLQRLGFVLGIDIQGFVRKIEGDKIVTAPHADLSRIVKACDYLKADVEELACVLDHLKLDTAEELVRKFNVEELVVTAASKGGTVYTRDAWTISYKPEEPELPDDSTGAGDVFFATYLTRRLKDKWTIKESCKAAQETVIDHLRGKHIDGKDLVLV